MKLFPIFIYSIIVIILLSLGFLLLSNNSDHPYINLEKTGGIILNITGNSMYPTLNNSETFLCKPGNYKEGDIVAFYYKDKKLTHRIIKIINGNILTKGDNNLLPDPFIISKDDIICKVIIS